MDRSDRNTPAALARSWFDYAPTPLLDLPRLAQHCGIARVLAKDEGSRTLGNFKALGGMYAALRALARATGHVGVADLIAAKRPADTLPVLICASDGNHGLAVAAGARLAGAAARIYLHEAVPVARARRIEAQCGTIVRVGDTYDDAVAAAAAAAARDDGLLIADTSDALDDAVVNDVMAGYQLMAEEITEQLANREGEAPTHLFIQAGVGGLAAAMAEGLQDHLAHPRRIVVVEPDSADCVGQALCAGQPIRIPGRLETVAEMLSCGEASAPALRILLRHGATAISVDEDALERAVETMRAFGGPATTPSGAAGLAGVLSAMTLPAVAARLQLDSKSRVLLFATEGPVPGEDA